MQTCDDDMRSLMILFQLQDVSLFDNPLRFQTSDIILAIVQC